MFENVAEDPIHPDPKTRHLISESKSYPELILHEMETLALNPLRTDEYLSHLDLGFITVNIPREEIVEKVRLCRMSLQS